MKIDQLQTPCYVIDEGRLTDNLKILNGVMQRTGAKILLAQKAFSAFCEYIINLLSLLPHPFIFYCTQFTQR